MARLPCGARADGLTTGRGADQLRHGEVPARVRASSHVGVSATGVIETSEAIRFVEAEKACCLLQILMDNRGGAIYSRILENALVDRSRQHLKALEEIERDCIPGLVEVLRTEGTEGVRYALWDMTGWHEHYDPCIWRSRATDEQKQIGWQIWVRMEKIICTVLDEAHKLQIEETMDALEEGPESFYRELL